MRARSLQASALLRLVAVAIALAGLVDPAISGSAASRARLALVTLQPPSPAAESVRQRLVRDLGGTYEIVPSVTSDAAAAIVVGDQLPDERLPDTLLVATVSTPETGGPGVRLVRVNAPRETPSATAIHIDVEVEGSGVAGQASDVTAEIGTLEVGRASHRWTKDNERWHAKLDVIPVGEAPYVVRVRLKPDTTEGAATEGAVRLKPDNAEGAATEGAAVGLRPETTVGAIRTDAASVTPVVSGLSRTVADVVVDTRRSPFRVQFYEPRPSWATTFVRRSLEADSRFQVATLSFTSRGVSARTGEAVALADSHLDAFDVVIVGGLDRLSAADARSLDRYVRERGGAVVVVPDQRIEAGSVSDLFPSQEFVERLLEQPAKLIVAAPAPSLQASELLVLRALPPGSEVIARLPNSEAAGVSGLPVIASMPRGDGRLLLSGAMDAWRFRAADNAAFDHFWQSTIAGLALAVAPAIAVDVEPPLLRPGERAQVIVRVRSSDGAAVSASLDRNQPIRLLPDPEAGVYRGQFVARDTPGQSTLEVRAGAADTFSTSRTILVQSDVRRVLPSPAPSLSMLATSHRGIDVAPERLADLESFLRRAVSSPRVSTVRHPMRSAWWILPFAACLSGEWWLRRRRGLR